MTAFGGDPDRVTLAGWSHGACVVNILLASRVARGLYHRALLSSGVRYAKGPALGHVPGAHRPLAAAEAWCRRVLPARLPPQHRPALDGTRLRPRRHHRVLCGELRGTGDPNADALPTWPPLTTDTPCTRQLGEAFAPLSAADSDAKYAFLKTYLESQTTSF
ncbi:carboxylesterase family protein [Streptomyces sp. NPDC054833]